MGSPPALPPLVSLAEASQIHGQGLVARGAIRKGTHVAQVSPLAWAVDDAFVDSVCSFCFTATRDTRCSKCKVVRYCSQGCQRNDWGDHKEECGSLVKFEEKLRAARPPGAQEKELRKSFPSETVRVAARLLRRQRKDPATAALVGSLLSNRERFSQRMLESFAQQIIILKNFLDEDLTLTASDMLTLFCKLGCNNFHVCDDTLSSVGVAFYPTLNLLNHSCSPNCVVVFEKQQALVRSVRDIAAGEELTVPYIDVMKSRRQRQEELRERYLFDCHCQRCLFDPTQEDSSERDLLERLTCSNDCRVPFEKKAGGTCACTMCGEQVSGTLDEIQTRLEAAQNSFLEAKAVHRKDDKKAKTILTQVLEAQRSLLKFNDADLIASESLLFEVNLHLGHLPECLEMGQLLVEAYKACPFAHPMLGVQHLVNGKLQLFHQRAPDASRSLDSALTCLTLTHGINHHIITQQLRPLKEQVWMELEGMQRQIQQQ